MRRQHGTTVEAANFDEKNDENDGPNTMLSQRSGWKQLPKVSGNQSELASLPGNRHPSSSGLGIPSTASSRPVRGPGRR